MIRNYYKAAIIVYAVELLLTGVLVHGILIMNYGEFPGYTWLFQQVLGIVLIVLCFVSIFIMRQLFASGIIAERQRNELLRIKILEDQNNIYRQHRHDLYNHLTVISGLAQLGKLDSLRSYLASYLDDYNKSLITVNTGLRELDVILFAKISEAKNQGIDVEYDLKETVQCSQKQITRFIGIMSNALDNAIQACAQAGNQKTMAIKISGDLLDYIFQISNTYDQGITDLEKNLQVDGYTSKPGSVRGDGLSIMRRSVSKLRGNMQFRVSEGFCHVTIEIPRLELE